MNKELLKQMLVIAEQGSMVDRVVKLLTDSGVTEREFQAISGSLPDYFSTPVANALSHRSRGISVVSDREVAESLKRILRSKHL